ncbi:hypothetical protein OROMI_020049 [Orobanche minor]
MLDYGDDCGLDEEEDSEEEHSEEEDDDDDDDGEDDESHEDKQMEETHYLDQDMEDSEGEKKLVKVIAPDKWKEGAHKTTEGGGGKIMDNKLPSKKNSNPEKSYGKES